MGRTIRFRSPREDLSILAEVMWIAKILVSGAFGVGKWSGLRPRSPTSESPNAEKQTESTFTTNGAYTAHYLRTLPKVDSCQEKHS